LFILHTVILCHLLIFLFYLLSPPFCSSVLFVTWGIIPLRVHSLYNYHVYSVTYRSTDTLQAIRFTILFYLVVPTVCFWFLFTTYHRHSTTTTVLHLFHTYLVYILPTSTFTVTAPFYTLHSYDSTHPAYVYRLLVPVRLPHLLFILYPPVALRTTTLISTCHSADTISLFTFVSFPTFLYLLFIYDSTALRSDCVVLHHAFLTLYYCSFDIVVRWCISACFYCSFSAFASVLFPFCYSVGMICSWNYTISDAIFCSYHRFLPVLFIHATVWFTILPSIGITTSGLHSSTSPMEYFSYHSPLPISISPFSLRCRPFYRALFLISFVAFSVLFSLFYILLFLIILIQLRIHFYHHFYHFYISLPFLTYLFDFYRSISILQLPTNTWPRRFGSFTGISISFLFISLPILPFLRATSLSDYRSAVTDYGPIPFTVHLPFVHFHFTSNFPIPTFHSFCCARSYRFYFFLPRFLHSPFYISSLMEISSSTINYTTFIWSVAPTVTIHILRSILFPFVLHTYLPFSILIFIHLFHYNLSITVPFYLMLPVHSDSYYSQYRYIIYFPFWNSSFIVHLSLIFWSFDLCSFLHSTFLWPPISTHFTYLHLFGIISMRFLFVSSISLPTYHRSYRCVLYLVWWHSTDYVISILESTCCSFIRFLHLFYHFHDFITYSVHYHTFVVIPFFIWNSRFLFYIRSTHLFYHYDTDSRTTCLPDHLPPALQIPLPFSRTILNLFAFTGISFVATLPLFVTTTFLIPTVVVLHFYRYYRDSVTTILRCSFGDIHSTFHLRCDTACCHLPFVTFDTSLFYIVVDGLWNTHWFLPTILPFVRAFHHFHGMSYYRIHHFILFYHSIRWYDTVPIPLIPFHYYVSWNFLFHSDFVLRRLPLFVGKILPISFVTLISLYGDDHHHHHLRFSTLFQPITIPVPLFISESIWACFVCHTRLPLPVVHVHFHWPFTTYVYILPFYVTTCSFYVVTFLFVHWIDHSFCWYILQCHHLTTIYTPVTIYFRPPPFYYLGPDSYWYLPFATCCYVYHAWFSVRYLPWIWFYHSFDNFDDAVTIWMTTTYIYTPFTPFLHHCSLDTLRYRCSTMILPTLPTYHFISSTYIPYTLRGDDYRIEGSIFFYLFWVYRSGADVHFPVRGYLFCYLISHFVCWPTISILLHLHWPLPLRYDYTVPFSFTHRSPFTTPHRPTVLRFTTFTVHLPLPSDLPRYSRCSFDTTTVDHHCSLPFHRSLPRFLARCSFVTTVTFRFIFWITLWWTTGDRYPFSTFVTRYVADGWFCSFVRASFWFVRSTFPRSKFRSVRWIPFYRVRPTVRYACFLRRRTIPRCYVLTASTWFLNRFHTCTCVCCCYISTVSTVWYVVYVSILPFYFLTCLFGWNTFYHSTVISDHRYHFVLPTVPLPDTICYRPPQPRSYDLFDSVYILFSHSSWPRRYSLVLMRYHLADYRSDTTLFGTITGGMMFLTLYVVFLHSTIPICSTVLLILILPFLRLPVTLFLLRLFIYRAILPLHHTLRSTLTFIPLFCSYRYRLPRCSTYRYSFRPVRTTVFRPFPILGPAILTTPLFGISTISDCSIRSHVLISFSIWCVCPTIPFTFISRHSGISTFFTVFFTCDFTTTTYRYHCYDF